VALYVDFEPAAVTRAQLDDLVDVIEDSGVRVTDIDDHQFFTIHAEFEDGHFDDELVDALSELPDVKGIGCHPKWELVGSSPPVGRVWYDIYGIEQDILPKPYPSDAIYQDTFWGLDAIDSRDTKLDNTYNYRADGFGVITYVIDSGFNKNHQEFARDNLVGSNLIWMHDEWGTFMPADSHGSGVAGIIAGKQAGVAKNARVFGCTVSRGEGLDGEFASGSAFSNCLQKVNDHYDSMVARFRPYKLPAILNLSIRGGGIGRPFENCAGVENTEWARAKALFDKGVFIVAAAGNDDQNATENAPACWPFVFTVGGVYTDTYDRSAGLKAKTSYSYGKAIRMMAPAVSVRIPRYDSNTEFKQESGTSFAA